MTYYFPQKPGKAPGKAPSKASGTPPGRRHPISPSKGKHVGRRVAPASLLRRLFALVVDGVIAITVLLLMMVLGSVLSGDTAAFLKTFTASVQSLDSNPGLKMLVGLFGSMIYPAVTYTLTGGSSPGKNLLGLRIVDRQTGQKASMVKFVLRNSVGLSLSGLLFGFGYILAFFSKERLALHDLIFATQVVRLL